MGLAMKLVQDFSGTVRKRGQDYYWRGLVRILQGSDSAVKATVRGSQSYSVTLDWEPDGVLVAACSCVFFETEGPCKHLWATILAAEVKGHLALAASCKDLFLDDSGIDPEEVLKELEESGLVPPPLADPLQAAPPPPKVPAWQKKIAEVFNYGGRAMQGSEWPAKRQILYFVDVLKSSTAGYLVLTIETRDRKLDGSWSRNNELNLKHHQIADLPLAEDREILAALAGTRQYYSWSYSDI
jgi:hypothetical protein